MKRLFFAAAVLLLGCGGSDEAPRPVGPTQTERPVATCDATHSAEGPACAPRFDSCGDLEVPRLGGGCEPVGVPASACAKGFVHERGACVATLPTTPCPAGSIALPGMATCEPLVECGSGAFGAIPDSSSTVHVDASYGGGGSDGSRARPFTKIADAMTRVVDGGVVAVAAGTYEEDVAIAKRIELVGRCPSMVTIKGVATGERDGAILVTASGARVSSVSVTGPATGLIVDAAANVAIDSVRVHGGTVTTGVWLRKGATAASVRRVVVEDVQNYGILVSGSTAKIEGAHVRGVRENVSAIGLRVNPDPTTFAPAEATVTGSLIEKNDYANVQTISAKLTIESSVIRDGVPTGGEWGVGALASYFDASKTIAELTVRKSVVEGNSYMGLLARDAHLIVEDSVVRDTKLEEKDRSYGRGIVAQGLGQKRTTLTVRNSVVERNQETGIDVNGDAVARIEGTIVRETRANGDTGTGTFGEVLSKNAPELTIDRCLFTDNPHGGVLSSGRATITASRFERNGSMAVGGRGGDISIARSLIHDARPNKAGLDGHGVYAFLDRARALPAKVLLEDSVVDKVVKGGVVVFGGELAIRRSAIRNIAAEAMTEEAGIGIVIEREHPDSIAWLDVSQTLVEGAEAAGIAAMGGDAKLTGVLVRNVRAHDDGQFGDGVVAFGVFFSTGAMSPASISLEGSIIEKNARAGVAIFGSTLSIASSFVTCNRVALNVEAIGGWNGTEWVPHEFALKDGGGNVCGCDTQAKCSAASSNLRPISSRAPRPEL